MREKKEKKNHIFYHTSLFTILVLGVTLIFVSSPNFIVQALVVVLMVLFYVGFGILHHIVNHDLSSKIVIEYVLIGVLGLTVMFLFLKNVL